MGPPRFANVTIPDIGAALPRVDTVAINFTT
jgi:hypothetical protein